MKIDSISASRYDQWDQCKLKYKLRNIDKLPEDFYLNYTGKNATQFGLFIHEVLEKGYKCKELKDLVELEKELRDSYTLDKGRLKEVNACLKNFLEFNQKIESSTTVGVEEAFDMDLIKGVRVRGVIDRIVKGSEGGYLVIDYKTSKREKKAHELARNIQMSIYAIAVSKIYKVPLSMIKVAHFYPRTGNFVPSQITMTQAGKVLTALKEQIKKIKLCPESKAEPQLNDFCNYCGYKGICPKFGYSTTDLTKLLKEHHKKS